MKPSIGRIVHYKHTSGQVCPAIILSVSDNYECALQIFRVTETYVNPETPFDPSNGGDPKAGHWFWPPRV